MIIVLLIESNRINNFFKKSLSYRYLRQLLVKKERHGTPLGGRKNEGAERVFIRRI